jgi:hypothetical protein
VEEEQVSRMIQLGKWSHHVTLNVSVTPAPSGLYSLFFYFNALRVSMLGQGILDVLPTEALDMVIQEVSIDLEYNHIYHEQSLST